MTLKNILPFEDYILTTKLPVDEVCRRIRDNVEPKRNRFASFSRRDSTKPYEGQVLSDSFTISRIINYRNSFLPVIKGQIITFLGQTQIHITMRPVNFVLIFMSLWLGVVGTACLLILIGGVLQFQQIMQHGFSLMMLIPFVMFLFGCLLITFAFKGERKNSKEFLATLLEEQQKDNIS